MKKKISITISEKTLNDIESAIDNIFIRNRSQAVEHLIRSSVRKDRNAVILCGGPGKNIRLDEKTYCFSALYKGLSVIETGVRKLKKDGFRNLYIIARESVLTKIFKILKDGSNYGVKINYIEEKESKGTAHSLRLIKGKISTNFLVVYGDIVFDRINIEGLYNDHIKQGPIATIMLTTSDKPSTKGTVKVEGNTVLEFTQKPRQSGIYLVFSPIFMCEQEILEYSGNSLEKDVFPELAKKGLLNGHLSSEKELHVHSVGDLKA